MPQLLDHAGRPVRIGDLRREQAAPTITGVRSVLSGHPAQGLTPQRLASILRQAEDSDPVAYLELAEQIEERDLHYLGVLGTRKRQVAQLQVTVEAASDAAEDVAAADLVTEWLARDQLQDELFDILDAIGKGYSFTEILWDFAATTKAGEPAWLPRQLVWRDPRWFVFDRIDGTTPLLLGEHGERTPAPSPEGTALQYGGRPCRPLAPFKWICHAPKAKSGLPVRGGLARPIAWAWLFKAFSLRDWVSFLEAYVSPIRLGRYPGGASEDDRATLLRAVQAISKDFAGIVPEGMAIEFVQAKAEGRADLFQKLAEYLDRQVSKAVLGQTMTTDDGASLSQAKVHNEVRGDIEAADAGSLAATLNRDLVRPIIDLNRGPRRAYPRLVIGRAEQTDVAQLTASLATLVPMGLRVEESVARDLLGLPEPAKDGLVLAAPGGRSAAPVGVGASGAGRATPEAEPGADGAQPGAAPAAGKKDRDKALNAAMVQAALNALPAAEPDAIDQAGAELLADWQPAVAPTIEEIRRLLAESASLEEFERRLVDLAAQPGGADLLAELLAKGLFAARVGGQAGADL